MFQKFNFKDLFVLDMANNHQGSLQHGNNIIDQHSSVVEKFGLRAGIKFQFRNIPAFVHPEDQIKTENKHVPRFLSTKLEWDDYAKMVARVHNKNLLAICTPFDEYSVEKIVELGFDIIKIASCSAKDWPLLEKVAETGLPVIASTGGLSLEEVDKLVSFLNHKGCEFALMHCVSIYPTPSEFCNLSTISEFRERYNGITIGWSTHENQDAVLPVAIAKSLGAEMFERHIGVETPQISLNAYSSTPAQAERWMSAYIETLDILGKSDRSNIENSELEALNSLKRGVFAKHDLEKGAKISSADVYFAFPYREGQISSGEFKNGTAVAEIKCDEPLSSSNCKLIKDSNQSSIEVIKHAIHSVKALLSKANVTLNQNFATEYSHHYGVNKFFKVGTTLITVVNREYAKKILVQLPGQSHPLHMHKLKEETFLVISGNLDIELDGSPYSLRPGEQITVMPGVWHQFKSENGCVFEEISTTAYPSDSYYRDPKITQLTSEQRKTKVDHWGRFVIDKQLRDS